MKDQQKLKTQNSMVGTTSPFKDCERRAVCLFYKSPVVHNKQLSFKAQKEVLRFNTCLFHKLVNMNFNQENGLSDEIISNFIIVSFKAKVIFSCATQKGG
ncbi:conserved hypothetical protein [Ricinus communis]|uniref:Uncharacterized protein n=1 Tax=Ricinus communis TaxID=3988 RepID=B9SY97_RICCO|nr:conserved hypothetical protein [Ricinus communis]